MNKFVGVVLIIIGFLMMTIAFCISSAKVNKLEKELEHQKVLNSITKSEGHRTGFIDGALWVAQNPFPTDEEGKTIIDLKLILDAQTESWDRRKESQE